MPYNAADNHLAIMETRSRTLTADFNVLFTSQGPLTASCPPCRRTQKAAALLAAQVSVVLMAVLGCQNV